MSVKELKYSLTFSSLLRLKTLDRELYQEFFELYNRNENGIVEKAIIIYIAYRCANLDNYIEETKFLELLEDEISAVDELYTQITTTKRDYSFYECFKNKTRSYKSIEIPKFELKDIEDYYTFYVLISNIPADTFWNSEIPFIEAVALNKTAFDGYINYQEHKLMKN